MLADPGRTAADHLRDQHQLLRDQIDRRQRSARALEKEMEARQMGLSLTPEEQFEVFGTDKVGGEWADEAQRAVGRHRRLPRVAAPHRRVHEGRLGRDEGRVRRRAAGVRATLMQSGAAGRRGRGDARSPRQHRQFIGRWFYDCGYDLHRGLAEMYVVDDAVHQDLRRRRARPGAVRARRDRRQRGRTDEWLIRCSGGWDFPATRGRIQPLVADRAATIASANTAASATRTNRTTHITAIAVPSPAWWWA